jgi:hypothetical protein
VDITIQRVPGADAYTAIRARFKAKIPDGLPIPSIPVEVGLRPSGGQRPAFVPVLLHKDGYDERFTVAWKYPYDFRGYENANLELRQSTIPGPPKVIPIGAKASIDISQAIIYSIIAWVGGIGFAIFTLYRYNSYKFSNISEAFSKFDNFYKDVSRYMKYFLPTSFISLSYFITVLANYFSMDFWFLLIILAPALAGFLGLLAFLTIKDFSFRRFALQGTTTIELPVRLRDWHVKGRLAVLCFAILILVILSVNLDWARPYDPNSERFHFDASRTTGRAVSLDQPTLTNGNQR